MKLDMLAAINDYIKADAGADADITAVHLLPGAAHGWDGVALVVERQATGDAPEHWLDVENCVYSLHVGTEYPHKVNDLMCGDRTWTSAPMAWMVFDEMVRNDIAATFEKLPARFNG